VAERKYESPDDAKRRTGVVFDMRGGPYDGMLLRLYPGRYAPCTGPENDYRIKGEYNTRYRGTEGWDELPCEGGRYVRPPGIDPFMDKKKANKMRTNVPHMMFEAAASRGVDGLDGGDLDVA
jgi:hypothetical protein